MACPPGVKLVCSGVSDAVGSVVGSAADDVFGSIVKAFNKAFGDALTLMSTFWLKIPTPQLSSTAGPVGALTGNLAWLTGAVAVAGILVAAIRMAVLRSSRPAVDLAKGLGRLVFAVFALLPLMALGASLGDDWSTWIVDQGTGGDFAGHVAGILSGLAALSPGLLLVIAILGVLSALVQVVLMLVRVGVLIVLAGAIPTLAAGSSTRGGEHAYKRALAWAAAFLLYKPLAATLFAGAFYAVGSNGSAVQSLAGWTLILLSIVALPALLKLVHPAVEAATSVTGGSAQRNAQTVATGAMRVGQLLAGAGALRAGAGAAGAAVAAVTRPAGGDSEPTGSTPSPSSGAGSSSPAGRPYPRPVAVPNPAPETSSKGETA